MTEWDTLNYVGPPIPVLKHGLNAVTESRNNFGQKKVPRLNETVIQNSSRLRSSGRHHKYRL